MIYGGEEGRQRAHFVNPHMFQAPDAMSIEGGELNPLSTISTILITDPKPTTYGFMFPCHPEKNQAFPCLVEEGLSGERLWSLLKKKVPNGDGNSNWGEGKSI